MVPSGKHACELWVASCRDGFLSQPSEPWRLQDPNAVFFEKADTIPHLRGKLPFVHGYSWHLEMLIIY
jgi:hypothetical protein